MKIHANFDCSKKIKLFITIIKIDKIKYFGLDNFDTKNFIMKKENHIDNKKIPFTGFCKN